MKNIRTTPFMKCYGNTNGCLNALPFMEIPAKPCFLDAMYGSLTTKHTMI